MTIQAVLQSALQAILEIIRGERALHLLGPRPAAAGSGLHEIALATRMRAYLRYVAVQDEQGGILFGLLRSEEEQRKLADIRLDLAIEPAFRVPPEVGGGVQVDVALPAFLTKAPRPDAVRLRLIGGDMAEVVWQQRDPPVLRHVLWRGRRLRPDRLDTDLVLTLLETLADWSAGGRDAPPRPLSGAAPGQIGDLIAMIAAGLRHLGKELRTTSASAAPAGLLSGLMGEGYRIAEARARFLAHIGRDGRILPGEDARAASDASQQIDIEAAVPALADPLPVTLSLRLADFLVEGHPYFARFRDALLGRAGPDVSDAARHEAPDVVSEAFRRAGLGAGATGALRDGAGIVAIIRAKRGRHDINLVLIRGPLDGQPHDMLMEVAFSVTPWPAVEVSRVEKAGMLLIDGPLHRLQPRHDGPQGPYLATVLALLAIWWRAAPPQ
jgi:hypothetical protein